MRYSNRFIAGHDRSLWPRRIAFIGASLALVTALSGTTALSASEPASATSLITVNTSNWSANLYGSGNDGYRTGSGQARRCHIMPPHCSGVESAPNAGVCPSAWAP